MTAFGASRHINDIKVKELWEEDDDDKSEVAGALKEEHATESKK